MLKTRNDTRHMLVIIIPLSIS